MNQVYFSVHKNPPFNSGHIQKHYFVKIHFTVSLLSPSTPPEGPLPSKHCDQKLIAIYTFLPHVLQDKLFDLTKIIPFRDKKCNVTNAKIKVELKLFQTPRRYWTPREFTGIEMESVFTQYL
jgi:hypothetical protein